VDNIKRDLGVIGWGGMDWIDVARDRDRLRALVNTVMEFAVPSDVGKSFEYLHSCL
jgi:hypothetical protein